MKIFLIGPGGVGKSTCGAILANMLTYTFVDLDKEFCNRIEIISTYIQNKGYKKYCEENSKLFYDLLEKNKNNTVFALSSGFLVHENMNTLTTKHKKTLQTQGISILLLPSNDREKSTEIVVKRQLSRGFWLQESKERKKIIQRFTLYKNYGDIKIFSYDHPEKIAKKMKEKITEFIVSRKAAA